jgi:hypothetical protein
MALNGKNAIAVDWDGCCVQEIWPREGDWLPGAQDALRALAAQYDVWIWTTRIVGREYEDWHRVVSEEKVAKQIAYIRRMLDEADLGSVNIFVSYPDHGVGKLSAKAYVDDRAIRFEGDWTATIAAVQGQVPAKVERKRQRRSRQRV